MSLTALRSEIIAGGFSAALKNLAGVPDPDTEYDVRCAMWAAPTTAPVAKFFVGEATGIKRPLVTDQKTQPASAGFYAQRKDIKC